MSTITATGSTLESALAAAVAELVSCDPDDVTVRVDAPGLEDVAGEHRFELRVEESIPEPPHESEAVEDVVSDDDFDVDLAESDLAAEGGLVEDVDAPDADAIDEPDEVVEESDGVGISPEDLDEEADAAADFIEGLLDALDLPGDLKIRIHPDHAEIEIIDIGSGALIGRRGQTLEAIQELVRCTLQRQFQRRARVKIDAEGYRSRRLEKLIEKAEEAIEAVLETGEPERLEPMDVFERKAIHQLVAEVEGLDSRSQGREPARRVMIERV